MAQINGVTGQLTSHFAYYIVVSESDVNVANNTSLVSAWVYVQKVGGYSVEGSQNSHTLYIDGTGFNANPYIDMNPETTPRLLVSGSKTVTHNANGSKTITVSSSGQITYIAGAYYSPQSGSASGTVTLTTIPRQAQVTSSPSLTIGNNLGYTLSNAGGLYVRLEYWIKGNAGWYKVIDSQRGTGSSGTLSFGATENNAMYSRMPSVTSASCILRAYTYSDAGYSTQVGDYHDSNGTVAVNQTTNKPTFTDWAVAPIDKTINVVDKYSNALVSSSTDTLRGSASAVIKGYEKVRATVSSANKMVALNYATGSKYRFIGTGSVDVAYGAGDVTVDLDNQTGLSYSITAYDSRNLTTTVNKSIATLIDYSPVSLWGLTLARDNRIDSPVTMTIEGSYFYGDFIAGGATNTITAHYRFKETTEAWGAQTWESLTLTDTSGSLSFNDEIEGDLGASGFDTSKSYNVEVRIYDKLSAVILEGTIDKGQPVLDIVKEGVAFGDLYDTDIGGALQVNNVNIAKGIYRGEGNFVNPVMTNSWVDYSYLAQTPPYYDPAGLYVDPFGFVHCEGLVKNGSGSIFTLPLDLTPNRKVLIQALSEDTPYTRLDLNNPSTGQLGMTTVNNTWVTLDGVGWCTFNRGWIRPTFENSWVNYITPSTATYTSYEPALYYKDELGFVHLRGMVKDGTGGHGNAIFTLPTGYRPAEDLMFSVMQSSNVTRGRVAVHSDGTVDLHNGATGWVSLNGIYFMAESSPYWSEWSSITLTNGWVDTAESGYMGAMHWISPDGVYHIMGMVDNGDSVASTSDQDIFAVPSEVSSAILGRHIFTNCGYGSAGSVQARIDYDPATETFFYRDDTTNVGGAPSDWGSLSGIRLRLKP